MFSQEGSILFFACSDKVQSSWNTLGICLEWFFGKILFGIKSCIFSQIFFMSSMSQLFWKKLSCSKVDATFTDSSFSIFILFFWPHEFKIFSSDYHSPYQDKWPKMIFEIFQDLKFFGVLNFFEFHRWRWILLNRGS